MIFDSFLPKILSTKLLVSTVIFAFLLSACGSDPKPTGETPSVHTPEAKISHLVSPKNNARYTSADTVAVEVALAPEETFDSIQFSIDDVVLPSADKKSLLVSIPCDGLKMGQRKIAYRIYKAGKNELRFATVKVMPAKAPKQFNFRVINSYPHDIQAYTQGLVYNDGFLYEGTGQYGESTLRKVELKTGKVLQSVSQAASVFGEGIALVDDMIYQISWKEATCFVYRKSDFSLVKTFGYNTEGWGLTYDGKHLIMSDGTEFLYFINPTNFKVEDKIEVTDEKNSLRNLNELEYIHGEIWANVYQSMIIARINPKTGAVNSYMALNGILQESEIHDKIDVLNGIAYDEAGDRLFVTGKNWPRMFEIDVY